MAVISDRLTDGAKLGRGAQIVFYARGLRDSVDGDAILTQARIPVPVDPETGLFTTPNLEPGPYWCGIKWAAAQSFENFQIVIGDSDTRLWPLLEEALPYTPAQESLFKQYRDEVAEFVTTAEGLSTAQDEAVADLVASETETTAAVDARVRAVGDGTYAPIGSGGGTSHWYRDEDGTPYYDPAGSGLSLQVLLDTDGTPYFEDPIISTSQDADGVPYFPQIGA